MIKKDNIFSTIKSLRTCITLSNRTVKKLMVGTLILGLFASAVEYLFAITLQNFFMHLGLLKIPQILFTIRNLETSILLLLGVGFSRSVVEGLKILLARLSQQEFANHTRYTIISKTLHNASLHSTNKVVSLFSEETNRASVAILNLSSLLIHSTLAIILMIYCAIVFTKASFIGLLLILLFGLPYQLFEKRISKTGILLSEEWEKTSSVLMEGIRNNFYLKIIGKIEQEVGRASIALQKHRILFLKVFLLISTKAATPTFIGVLVLSTIGYLQYKLSLFGPELRMLEFFYLFIRFTQSASVASTLYSDFVLNSQSVERINQWYENQPLIKQTTKDYKKINLPKELSLELKEVSFSYHGPEVIKDLSLKISTGDVITIMGESGAGKSTLLSLILGILKPTKGKILLNNNDVFEFQDSITSLVSYVGPHPFIIEGTIKENLLYGLDHSDINNEKMLQVLEHSCLKDFIQGLPKQLENKINETGSQLSTGQKQRLMIARALLRQPKILVMDEATANLDQSTEMELINNLKSYLPTMITIIVTHKNTFNHISTQALNLKANH